METVLIFVTIASAATALVMGAIVMKMLRDERRRSDARVEALMDLAGPLQADVVAQQPAHRLVPSHFHPVAGPQKVAATSPAQNPVADRDLELNAPVSGVGGMFQEPDIESPWRSRFAVALACAALVAIIGFGLSSLTQRADRTDSVAEAAPAAPALDLLSLRHAAEGETLTITGMVQNPRGGTALEHVTATAFVFAQDGSLLASARAPLDFTRLGPGEESPFVVKVPAATGVARYRVSFRDSGGSVIGHVDRRNSGPLARHE